MPAGLAAFLYVAGLWIAAPALDRSISRLADRIRAMLLLGMAIPFGLGAVHLLYTPAVWVVLGIIMLRALSLTHYRVMLSLSKQDPIAYAVLAASLVVIWPPLVRPLLDGDSLAYHLPNAASWVQAHSIWISSAPYWFYPPGSEMFASGLLAASGRWSLPLAGVLPAWLLCARLYSIARESGAPYYAAAAVPLAFICTPLAAFESGTLQNDLWLAAFFVDILATRQRAMSIAAAALIKPFGWIEAALAAAIARIPFRCAVIASIPLLFWIARDLVLFKLGPVAPSGPQPAYWPTTIAANFTLALPQLVHGTFVATPQCLVWLAFIVVALFLPQGRRYAIAGALAFVVYVLLPVSYSNGATNYVLDASSLRYALPALACGAAVAALAAARQPVIAAVCGYGVAIWGAERVLGVFWNDAYTRYAPLVALAALLATLFAKRTRAIPAVAVFLAVLVLGAQSAATRATGFYADWMRDAGGKPTGAFAWIARTHPAIVVADNVRGGAILMSSPQTRVLPAQTGTGCALARKYGALLLTGSNEETAPAKLQHAFAQARACGSVLYADGAAVIVKPPR